MNTYKCPFCYGEIESSARKCKHCGEWIKEQKPIHHQNMYDERALCSSCNKKMIPRIITGPPIIHGKGYWTPVPKKSICPFCAATHQRFPISIGEKLRLYIYYF